MTQNRMQARHLSMIDYIAIGGSMENRIIEYVDHLREHFYDPVVIKNCHNMPPSMPGYNIKMKDAYRFPDGAIWKTELDEE